MTLDPGGRVGAFSITGPLGAGGMGEVYRARDSRLNRDVAIKVLPELFALDPDRLARFEREAKTLAALNHPNIAAIYGIEDRALVMELVEGDDLSVRIARDPIPLDQALAIARQIADALEAAHERGIIHRDLKPANIKVREDGTVKVLDFGLAKAMDATAASNPDLMHSPTLTAHATQLGMILGTAAYMAPEQAKGRSVDKRADIWAFGVVLFEMLTGRRAFEGDDVSTTIAAVLMREPDWTALPAGTPAALRHLLHRCLERDPRRRMRDIGEARLVLEAPGGATADTGVPASRAVVRRLPSFVAAAAIVTAVVFAAMLIGRPNPATPVVRASIQLPEGTELAWAASNPTNLSISRDGSVIAFAAVALGRPASEAQLYIRRLDAAASVAVPDSEGVNVSFFSPDGRSLGFFANGVLKKVSLSGGAAVTLSRTTQKNIWGATWLSNGTIVYSSPKTTGEMLYSAPDAGGEPTLLSRVDRLDLDHSFPHRFGDDQLLVTQWTGGLYAHAMIARFSREQATVEEVILEGGSHPQVLTSGHLVYARGTELLAVGFDVKRGVLRGTPVSLLQGVVTDARYGTPEFAVAESGALVYASERDEPATAALQWIGPDGGTETLVEDRHLEADQARLSADGRHVIHQSISNNRDVDLWTYDTASRRRSRLTDVQGEEYSAVITSDNQVIFAAWRGVSGVYRVPLLGGREDLLKFASGVQNLQAWSISPDDRWLAVSGDGQDQSDLGIVDLTTTPHTVTWMVNSRFTERRGIFSPTGTHVAYESDQLGRTDVWVSRFSNGRMTAAVPVSRDGGIDAFWSRDGRALYYTSGSTLMKVDIGAGDTVTALPPRAVLDLKATRVFGIGPDGRFIAVRRERAPVTHLDVILNWTEEIRQRVK